MDRMARRRPWITVMAVMGVLLYAGSAFAHWCNNIWAAPSRIVVKPEVTTLYIGPGGTKLRVYVQNNLPYKMFATELRGTGPGYSIQVTPAQVDINPGQNVGFTFTISAPSGSHQVANMGLQLKFRPGGHPSSWIEENNNCMMKQGQSTSDLQTSAQGWYKYLSQCSLSNQATAVNAGTLADQNPNANIGSSAEYSRTGIQQLIKRFGYRFCWNSGGSWRSGPNDCPSPSPEGSYWTSTDQWGQDCMRAGVELGARKTKLGSDMSAARDGAVNALKGSFSAPQHKCIAAVVGAYLWLGAGNTSAFTSALNSSSNNVPGGCRNAATRILTGSPSSSCTSYSQYYERAACAAAEGIRNNNAVVKSILMDRAGDGYMPYSGSGYTSLYYSYMLYLVSAARQATYGNVSYYPDAGAPLVGPKPDQFVPKPDQFVPKPDQFVPKPDQFVPKPDQFVPKPDQKVVKKDQFVPKPDQFVPKADQKVVKKDQFVPKADQKVVKPDQFVPKADQKVVKKDTGAAKKDTGAVNKDSGTVPEVVTRDGCAVGKEARGDAGAGLLALLALLGLVMRRRRP